MTALGYESQSLWKTHNLTFWLNDFVSVDKDNCTELSRIFSQHFVKANQYSTYNFATSAKKAYLMEYLIKWLNFQKKNAWLVPYLNWIRWFCALKLQINYRNCEKFTFINVKPFKSRSLRPLDFWKTKLI